MDEPRLVRLTPRAVTTASDVVAWMRVESAAYMRHAKNSGDRRRKATCAAFAETCTALADDLARDVGDPGAIERIVYEAVLAERERCAKLARDRASEVREAEFFGPREGAEALRGVADAIDAGT